MSQKIILTKEGLVNMQVEIKFLKEIRRVEVAEKLKEAISYGDLSENSEYDDARNEQAQLELKIMEIEEILKNHEIVDEKKAAKKNTGVIVGSSVTIKSLDSGKKDTYKIVGSTESDILENKISNESPIGRLLIGKNVGEVLTGQSGSGKFEYEIIEIK